MFILQIVFPASAPVRRSNRRFASETQLALLQLPNALQRMFAGLFHHPMAGKLHICVTVTRVKMVAPCGIEPS